MVCVTVLHLMGIRVCVWNGDIDCLCLEWSFSWNFCHLKLSLWYAFRSLEYVWYLNIIKKVIHLVVLKPWRTIRGGNKCQRVKICNFGLYEVSWNFATQALNLTDRMKVNAEEHIKVGFMFCPTHKQQMKRLDSDVSMTIAMKIVCFRALSLVRMIGHCMVNRVWPDWLSWWVVFVISSNRSYFESTSRKPRNSRGSVGQILTPTLYVPVTNWLPIYSVYYYTSSRGLMGFICFTWVLLLSWQ